MLRLRSCAQLVILTFSLVLLSTAPAFSQDKELELIVQTGHNRSVGVVAFSPNGKLLASADDSGEINLWDAATGEKIRLLSEERDVLAMAFSPDGKMLVTGGLRIVRDESGRVVRDENGRVKITGTLKCWDVETGKLLKTMFRNNGKIDAIAFSPDGRMIASAANRGKTVELTDTATGELLKTLVGGEEWCTGLAFSPDGKRLAGASAIRARVNGRPSISNGTVTLWDVPTGNKIRSTVRGKVVSSVAFSPDGSVLATGVGDWQPGARSDWGMVKLWDVATGQELRTLIGHSKVVKAIAFSPDGKQIVSGSFDKTIRLWNVSTGLETRTFKVDFKVPWSVDFSPDGTRIAASGGFPAGSFKVWEVETGREQKRFKGIHANMIHHAVFGVDGKTLRNSNDRWFNTPNETKYVWNLETGNNPLTGKAMSEIKRDCIMIDAETIEEFRVNCKLAEYKYGWLSRDGKRVFTLKRGKIMNIFDVETGELIKILRGHKNDIWYATFSRNGKIFATGSIDYSIKLWDTENGELIRTLEGHRGWVYHLRFSPDDRMLASGAGGDNMVKLWDVATGELVKTFKGHRARIYGVDFSPDGKRLVSASWDRTIKIWDVTTGREIRTLTGHTADVHTVSYSPDGKFLVSGGKDQTLRLWDAETGKELIKLISLGKNEWVAIDPEGRFDGSTEGLKYIHYSYGLEIIDLNQLKEMYYEPGLLQKVMGYNREPLRNIVSLKDVRLHPEILEKKFDPDSKKLSLKLRARGGGIGETRVLVNGKLAVPDARSARVRNNPGVATNEIVTLEADLTGTSIRKGEENEIRIITSNHLKQIGKGNIQSRGVGVVFKDKGKKVIEFPSLYAVVAGTSDYTGDEIDLRFASKDAEDFSHALSLGARRLFCPPKNSDCLDKVNIITLSTSGNEGTIQPTKENFRRAFAGIAKKAKPDDIVVIYLAGHGVAFGTDTYFYLTKEARSASKESLAKNFQTEAISSEELTDWLTQEEWVAGEKGIKALKQVLILDTCAAATAARQLNLIAKRDLSGDQIRAIEFLKDKTGTHILMGSAADAPSYEASQFGQGLLTRSLLEGMKGAALDSDRIDVQTLFRYAERQVPRLAVRIGGIQQPKISVPTGQTFPIGQMTEAEKKQIALPSEKPFVSRPGLVMPPSFTDPLQLTDGLRKRFEDESSFEVIRRRDGRRETMLVYVDDASFPDAIRVTGSYTTAGDWVKLQAYLTKNERVIKELPPIETEKTGVIDELMAVIRKELEGLEAK